MKTMSKGRLFPAMLASAVVGGAIVYGYMNVVQPSASKLDAAMAMIEQNYLEPVDRTKLIDGAIEGMLQSIGDPYTTYMDQEEAKAFQQHISASFEGIGATMEEIDGRIVIVAPIKGSPAEAAGLKPNDQVIKVGDQSLEGMKVHEAVMLIRGKKGTKAELTILRSGKEIQITIVRDTIPLETVYSERKEENIGVIRIASFAETTAAEYKEAVKKLLDQGIRGLVIDLRQNPGGLVDAAEEISETILADGKPIVQFKRRGAEADVVRAKHNDIGLTGIPMAVLMDGGSASAAEIVAGALSLSADLPLIGEKTFGKGTAQTTQPFQDGSNIKYTIAEWLAPDGSTINKTGLQPDIVVKLPAYADLPFISSEIVMKETEFSDEIKYVQTMLNALGFDPEREDGFFDGATKRAVIRYQQARKLETTGVVQGDTTRSLIKDIRELIQANDTQLEKALEVVRERMN
jgi:carboxyl-terminal processing protease